jgi:hypothetical protein
MDPAPSDGITPASARDGMTERPPPRPGVVLPDPDAGPDIRLGLNPLPGHLAVVLALAVGHAFLVGPLVLCVVDSLSPIPSASIVPPGPRVPEWLVELIAWPFFFPLGLADAVWPGLGPSHPSLYLLNSLLWSATVYGLFLAGRWARTRLTRRSGFG